METLDSLTELGRVALSSWASIVDSNQESRWLLHSDKIEFAGHCDLSTLINQKWSFDGNGNAFAPLRHPGR